MTSRERVVEKAFAAIISVYGPCEGDEPEDRRTAAAVVDAILPQVTTVEELKALPYGSLLTDGERAYWTRNFILHELGGYDLEHDRVGLPLTVLWIPPKSESRQP